MINRLLQPVARVYESVKNRIFNHMMNSKIGFICKWSRNRAINQIRNHIENLKDYSDCEKASEDYENWVKEILPYKTMSGEEYAARFAHTIGCASYFDKSYSDETLELFILELQKTIWLEGRLKKARMKFLTNEEIFKIKCRENEDF